MIDFPSRVAMSDAVVRRWADTPPRPAESSTAKATSDEEARRLMATMTSSGTWVGPGECKKRRPGKFGSGGKVGFSVVGDAGTGALCPGVHTALRRPAVT